MEIHKKREKIEFRNKMYKALEPVFVLLTLLVFAFPVIAVLNLSPLTKSLSNVLGVQSGKLISIDVKDDKDSLPEQPYINTISDNSFRIVTNTPPLNEGVHKIKGITIRNISSGSVKITISASMESNTEIEVGYTDDNENQILQNMDGVLNNKELIVPAGISRDFTFYIKNTNAVNFNDILNINVTATEYAN